MVEVEEYVFWSKCLFIIEDIFDGVVVVFEDGMRVEGCFFVGVEGSNLCMWRVLVLEIYRNIFLLIWFIGVVLDLFFE